MFSFPNESYIDFVRPIFVSVLAEDAINAAIKNYHSKRKEGLTGAGTIDVSQSVVTGKTEATANPGSPSAA